MSVVELKKTLHELIDDIQDKDVLEGIMQAIVEANHEPENWHRNLTAEEKAELEISIKQDEEDEVVSNEVVLMKIGQWGKEK